MCSSPNNGCGEIIVGGLSTDACELAKRLSMLCLMIFLPCLTIAGECVPSPNNGCGEIIVGGLSTDACELAKRLSMMCLMIFLPYLT